MAYDLVVRYTDFLGSLLIGWLHQKLCENKTGIRCYDNSDDKYCDIRNMHDFVCMVLHSFIYLFELELMGE